MSVVDFITFSLVSALLRLLHTVDVQNNTEVGDTECRLWFDSTYRCGSWQIYPGIGLGLAVLMPVILGGALWASSNPTLNTVVNDLLRSPFQENRKQFMVAIFLRRLALAFISTFIRQLSARVALERAVLVVALSLQFSFAPFATQSLNRLESASLLITLLSSSLQWPGSSRTFFIIQAILLGGFFIIGGIYTIVYKTRQRQRRSK